MVPRSALSKGFSAILLGFGVAGSTFAYEDDAHFVFTYLASRAVGYTPEQSKRIASADVRVDYSSPTEPFEWLHILFQDKAYHPRHLFHSFSDDGPADSADCVFNLKNYLYPSAVNLQNPGIFMHAYQDLFSHQQYRPYWGHWDPKSTLPFGHYTDYMSVTGTTPGGRDQVMSTGTGNYLALFMTEYGGSMTQTPRPGYGGTVQQIFQMLVAANPKPSSGTGPYLGWAERAATEILKGREVNLPSRYNYNFVLPDQKSAVPDTNSAKLFSLWLPGVMAMPFTPNRAGISPGPVQIVAKSYDPWSNADPLGYVPFDSVNLPENGQSKSYMVPVGQFRVHYAAKGVDYWQKFAISTGRGDLIQPVHFDRFTVSQARNTSASGGNATISGIKATADVKSGFPAGQLWANIVVKDSQGNKHQLAYGGLNTYSNACHLENELTKKT